MKAPLPGDGSRPGPEAGRIETDLLAFLASSFLRQGRWRKARTLFGLLHALHPGQGRYSLALAYACLRLGRADEALARLAEAGFGPGAAGPGARPAEAGLPAWAFLLAGRALGADGRAEEARSWFGRLHETERTEA